MSKQKEYKTKRYLYFWLSILLYFVPPIIACCSLLPMTSIGTTEQLSVGITVVLLNAVPPVVSMLHKVVKHCWYINYTAVVYLAMSVLFHSETFAQYSYSLDWVEAISLVGMILAGVFDALHEKYKRKARTVQDMIDSGLVVEK